MVVANSQIVIPSPSLVILSEAKDLLLEAPDSRSFAALRMTEMRAQDDEVGRSGMTLER